MNKKPLPSGVHKINRKIMAILFCIVFSVSSTLFPISTVDAATLIPTIRAQTINQISNPISEYLEKLQKDGYTIVSYEPNLSRLPYISSFRYREEQWLLTDNLDVIVLCAKITIEGDDTTYYFKSREEAQVFIDKLNSIKTQTYSITDGNVSYSTITSTTVLDEKIAQVTTERDAEEQERQAELERARSKKVTSRGSSIPRDSYTFPLKSYVYISSYYGARNGKTHTGVDFAAYGGTHIYAWRAGTVTYAGWNGGYGNFIEVDHGDGFITRYAHCSKIAVKKGQTVTQGEVIGYVGTTGNSTGNHLHFEIKVNGKFVNPLNYVSI